MSEGDEEGPDQHAADQMQIAPDAVHADPLHWRKRPDDAEKTIEKIPGWRVP